jgi:hypothetical protein
MNPARTIGPDLVTTSFPLWWAYFAGPAAGAAAAVLLFALVRDRQTLTAKLFHDAEYPSVHATSLPAKPHRQGKQTAGIGADAHSPHTADRPPAREHAAPPPRAVEDSEAHRGGMPRAGSPR